MKHVPQFAIHRLLFPLFLLSTLLVPAAHAQPGDTDKPHLAVGSKKFTENVILGYMAAQLWEARGFRVTYYDQLGGSRFLWEALRRGDLDAYPDYTGTVLKEILGSAGIERSGLEDALAARGVRMTAPLGFNNTYALGMREARAEELGIRTISDLRAHPDLRLAFTNEFMNRGDGWPGVRAAYDLPQQRVQGVDHDIAYRGLTGGSVDVIDLYSTDAEIQRYDLRLLEDDRGFFPDYQAVVLYRADLARRAPDALAALRRLQGQLSEDTMQRLNREATTDGTYEPRVAAGFLNARLALEPPIQVEEPSRLARVGQRTAEHLYLVGVSLLLAMLVAVPLGILAEKTGWTGQGLLLLVGITYTVPSLALLAVMVPPLGIGTTPAIVALFLYSLLPIVWNTYTGLRDIPADVLESADALGLTARARLRRVELPLAARSVFAGVKIAIVINVGTATLGALIGAGGYGQPILTGIRSYNLGLILEGTVPAALLTVALLALFEVLERQFVSEGLRLAPEGG